MGSVNHGGHSHPLDEQGERIHPSENVREASVDVCGLGQQESEQHGRSDNGSHAARLDGVEHQLLEHRLCLDKGGLAGVAGEEEYQSDGNNCEQESERVKAASCVPGRKMP